MKVITHLTDEEFERLAEIAVSERRTPQDQASFLLSKILAEEGVPAAKAQAEAYASQRTLKLLLHDIEFDSLTRRAEAELRPITSQAVVLLRQGLGLPFPYQPPRTPTGEPDEPDGP
jgi:hypothetical protein